jgi:sec-independent protein translocase protein TatA
MPNIGTGEILLLLLLALLLFGAKRLPEIGRSLGSGMREFKDSVTGTKDSDTHVEATATPTEAPAAQTELPVATTTDTSPAPTAAPQDREPVA